MATPPLMPATRSQTLPKLAVLRFPAAMAAELSPAMKLICFLLAISGVVMMIRRADAAISCSTVTSDLLPCLSYVAGNAAQPTAGCCNGVRSLNAAAKTTPDRRTACNCIKSAASSIRANYDKVGKLPGSCGVNLGYTITPSINCATIP